MSGFRDLNLKFSLDLAIYEQFEFHVEHEKRFYNLGTRIFHRYAIYIYMAAGTSYSVSRNSSKAHAYVN